MTYNFIKQLRSARVLDLSIGLLILTLLLTSCVTTTKSTTRSIVKLGATLDIDNTDLDTLTDRLDQIKMLDIKFVRLLFAIDQEEFTKGDYNPNLKKFEQAINLASERSLTIIAVLNIKAQGVVNIKDLQRSFVDKVIFPMVSRYSDKIDYWEIAGGLSKKGNQMLVATPKDYIEFLKLATAPIRKLDQAAIIISSITGSSRNPDLDWQWQESLLELELGEYVDIISVDLDLENEIDDFILTSSNLLKDITPPLAIHLFIEDSKPIDDLLDELSIFNDIPEVSLIFVDFMKITPN
ncbi:MAG: hypothetical protein ACN4E2_03680 [Nitrospinota bacterium]